MASLSELTLRDALTASTPATYYEEGSWRKPSWATAAMTVAASGAEFTSFGSLSSAYWNTSFGAGSACSIDYFSGSQANERYFDLWVCLTTAESGYRCRFVNVSEAAESHWKAVIARFASGVETPLTESAVQTVGLLSQELALWNNHGQIMAWAKPSGGEWGQLCSIADATYTSGFTGFEGSGSNPHFQNFKAGELAATTFGTSLMPVVV